MIDIICEQISFKDEAINIKIIQCLQHLMTSSSCEIHGDAVIQVIKTLIEIHKQIQQGKNQGLARNAALQIIHVMYMRMEQVTILNEDDRKIYRNKKSTPNNWINPANNTSNNNNNQNNQSNSQLDMNIMLQSLETSTMLFRYYVKKVVGHCIDDVCLFDAKKKEILLQAAEMFQGEDKKEEKEEFIQKELSLLPIRSAPLLEDSKKPEYQQIKTVSIKNEQNIESGKFGWCFICRNTAKNYCKDTRVPICSESCKLQHLEEISRLEKISEDRQSYLYDGILVFQYLSQAALLETQHPNPLQIKETHLILEMLLSIFESGGPVFMSKKEFVNVIKNYLVQSLLQNCLNSEKSIFVLSFSLVVDLVTNFRENLKKEVVVFVQDIFLNILDSNNSNFNHRMFTISAFHKIFKVPRTVLELFVNYDCALGNIGIVENIITMLTRVGQGKYLKQEYSTLILPQQEFLLKKNSVEAMKELVKRLCEFSDQCEQNANDDFGIDEENIEFQKENSSNNLTVASSEIQIDQNFDRIEKEKNKKQTILKAIQLFNLKAKNGISYLIQQKIIDQDDHKQLALILFQYNNFINQEIFGQFLGNESNFNQQTMSEFIDLLDFRNIYVDQAMRDLLTYFQLPGEAQQVDRILQKFGEKYINDNAGQTYIKNGNVAYVFSYSLMMLQTSLHNPQVQDKDRMTYEQFKNLIKGINEEDGVKDNIDPEEIARMYKEIESRPLALHKEKVREDKRDQALNLNEKQKKNLFLQECNSIVQQSQSKIDSSQDSQIAGIQSGQYVQVFSLDFLKSLMKEIWSPLFVSFSQNFEESDDKALLESCLEGIVYCIKLLGISGLTTEKETFLYVLTKFSGLTQEGQIIKEKNIMSIKSILKCALTAGNYLFQSWKIILKCVSQIEFYQVQGSKTKVSQVNSRRHTLQKDQLIELQNSETIVANIETGQIDKIFHLSHHLSPEQIKIFIKCLCQISKEELDIEDNPRIFCMQRISEVTGFNMKRVKYNWQEIWSDLSKFFYEAGTHVNPQIQELSVDFLKQLALKFLEQKELKHFTFQKDFLAPFEQIYLNMKINNDQLKELIISCIYMLTNQSFYNLMSGWKIILRIVNLAIQDNQPNLVQVSFMIIKKIMNEKLENILDVMIELVQALTSLSKSNHEIYAVQSILYLKKCLDFLILNSKKQIKDIPQQTQEQLIQIERSSSSNLPKSEGITDLQLFQQQQEQIQQQIYEKHLKSECQKNLDTLQLPVMSGMAKLFDRDGKDVQKKSLEILFQIIQENCQDYSSDFWKQVFKNVLKPLFEEICIFFSKKQFTSQEQYYKTEKATIYAFERFQELILSNFEKVSIYFQEIIDIVQYCAKNQVKNLVNLSTSWLISVLEQIGENLNEQQWQIVINMIQNIHVSEIFETEKLLKTNDDLQKPFDDIVNLIPQKPKIIFNIDINQTINQTMNQFLITVMAKKIFSLFSEKFTQQQIESILKVGEQAHEKAKYFNEQFYLRYALWKYGLMADLEIVPGLYVHEKESFSLLLETLSQLSKSQNYKGAHFDQLVSNITNYLTNYKNLIEDFLKRSQQPQAAPIRRKSISLEENQQNQNSQNKSKKTAFKNTFQQQSQHSSEELQQMFILGQKQRITYMKQVIQGILLPLLNQIPLGNLGQNRVKNIVFSLIDVSNHSFNQSLANLTCKVCSQCDNCLVSGQQQYSYNEQIKAIMKKFFEFSFSLQSSVQNSAQDKDLEEDQGELNQEKQIDQKEDSSRQVQNKNKNKKNSFIQIKNKQQQDDFIESRNSSYEIIRNDQEQEKKEDSSELNRDSVPEQIEESTQKQEQAQQLEGEQKDEEQTQQENQENKISENIQNQEDLQQVDLSIKEDQASKESNKQQNIDNNNDQKVNEQKQENQNIHEDNQLNSENEQKEDLQTANQNDGIDNQALQQEEDQQENQVQNQEKDQQENQEVNQVQNQEEDKEQNIEEQSEQQDQKQDHDQQDSEQQQQQDEESNNNNQDKKKNKKKNKKKK